MSDQSNLLPSIGLCARAGKLIYGIPMVCDAMKRGGAGMPRLVLEAADTSDNSHKRISDRCRYYGVTCVRLAVSGAQLGAAVGKTTVLGAVGITDDGLAGMIKNKLGE